MVHHWKDRRATFTENGQKSREGARSRCGLHHWKEMWIFIVWVKGRLSYRADGEVLGGFDV